MNLELQPKYITCKIDVKMLFDSIIKLLTSDNDEIFERKEFGLVYNDDLEIYEVKFLGNNIQYNKRKYNIIKDIFGITEEQEFTNVVLEKLFSIKGGKGCIQYHDDYFDEDSYYYILMPFETFETLQLSYKKI